MDRLNKKCFVASTGLHLLLGAAIFVGPAFTASNSKNDADLPVINFEPDILVDADIVGGGNPRAARQPASQPPAAQPQPQPVAQPPRPEPKVVERRQPEPQPEKRSDPDAVEEKPAKKPKGPQVSTKLETKKATKKPSPNVETAAQERQYAEDTQRIASALAKAGESLQPGSAVNVAEVGNPGPGGGGPAYAGIKAWIKKLFYDAWLPPENANADTAICDVRIVIARDGTVISSEFVSRSADAAVNASVQRALDRVPTIRKPLPEGSGSSRIFILTFDLKVKRGIA